MHLVIDRAYAERYYPGTAMTLASAIWLGMPIWMAAALAWSAFAVAMFYRVTAELIDGFARGPAGRFDAFVVGDISLGCNHDDEQHPNPGAGAGADLGLAAMEERKMVGLGAGDGGDGGVGGINSATGFAVLRAAGGGYGDCPDALRARGLRSAAGDGRGLLPFVVVAAR